MDKRNMCLDGLHAGCSALSWSTLDGRHLWGRNFDFNRLAEGSGVIYIPRGTVYWACGNQPEGTAREESRRTAAYAAVGTGLMPDPTLPVLYEGINERGLMGGQLYYREFAHYGETPEAGKCPLQPPMAVYHLLAQCATVEEVVRAMEKELSLTALPMFGTVPPLHWAFSDRTGEMVVLEPDKDGLHIYRNTVGVMANSPGYPWHRLNLLNYAEIRDLDYDGLELEGEKIPQCFSGSGAQGLPGDWSSPSRFVRLTFLRKYGVKGRSEEEGVARMFRLFQSAAFPDGMVRVSEQGHVTELDTGVVPYDYTVYTALMCAESLRFYWTTYQNQRIRCVDLRRLMDGDGPARFSLDDPPEIRYLTEPPEEC